MNYDVLVELGLAPSLITALHVSQWGSEVAIACLYDPDNARRPYRLVFHACDNLHWEVVNPGALRDAEADFIDFAVGVKDGRSVAIIEADIFELVMSYGSYDLEHDW